MANRTLELALISAKDLKDVNMFSKMNVYAVATISGDHRTQQRTTTDRNGGNNPSWNATLRFPVPADLSATGHLVIHVLLRSERALGDRDVGEVHIPFKELHDGSKFASYQVRKSSSSKAKGVLNLSYKFVDLPASTVPPPEAVNVYPPPPPDKQKKGDEPVMAYPATTGASGSAYPSAGGYSPYPPQGAYDAYPAPPQAGYGYGGGYGHGAPPQAGYGYGAPPPAGYGYNAVPPKKKKNNFGMGLGAGLLGGALGGMLIDDVVSDYGGMDDGFGF